MTQNITSMNMAYKNPVKVDIVFGFRGAGKTTLIKRMAEEIWEGERIVFLQNEFGKENLSRISLQSGWYVRDVQTGCICCNGAQLLAQTFFEIMEECRPDRIVLEAAETARIESFQMLLEQEATGMYELDHVLYVCNTGNFMKKMLISGRFLENELKQTPVIFLSHTEGLTEEKRDQILQTIERLAPDSTIVQKDWRYIPSQELQSAYESSRSIPTYERKNILSAFAEFTYNE